MDSTLSLAIDYGAIARQFQLQEPQIRETVLLLDEGNTVPFITRYRKDRTGGLDEEKIRLIEEAVARRRQLIERKERILCSIQSQEALTPELDEQIRSASSLKVLDDLYLPFRPKKQTLATVARQRGLEPVSLQILNASGEMPDLDTLLSSHVDAEKSLSTTADVVAGVKHILAEILSERPNLRAQARKHVWGGQIVCKRIEHSEDADVESALDADDPALAGPDIISSPVEGADPSHSDGAAAVRDDVPGNGVLPDDEVVVTEVPGDSEPSEAGIAPSLTEEADAAGTDAAGTEAPASEGAADDAVADADVSAATPVIAGETPDDDSQPAEATVGTDSSTQPNAEASEAADAGTPPAKIGEGDVGSEAAKKAALIAVQASVASKREAAEQRRKQRREARHRKRQKLEQSFKDYFDFTEPIKKLPHYRVLAINRGERCKVLRVKIGFDTAPLKSESRELAFAADHPYAELLTESLNDALTRLIIPSIEREVRRELTERAEAHAVKVFAQNLRKLLLQAPLRGRRVIAIDPGFRSGCKLAALDEFGNVLGHSLIHVIGAAERVQQSRARLAEMIKTHQITVVAVGNGTACRETEQLVASVLSDELAADDVHYVIVNEAGASVYSTSQLGREELPRFDATVRGAVSIGRRALDPLSELVKIDPASIGVGLYQHDVKAKHLRVSLDAVVESCVNFVGVDVNSASPALLSYVSGLNQLTARRVYEHRQKNGPFRDRQQLMEVPGVGEATFVQASGFLKVVDGDNPLDSTWIHPESYDVAKRVLESLGCEVAELSAAIHPRPTQDPPTTDPAASGAPGQHEPPGDAGEATPAEAIAAGSETVVSADAADTAPESILADDSAAIDPAAPTADTTPMPLEAAVDAPAASQQSTEVTAQSSSTGDAATELTGSSVAPQSTDASTESGATDGAAPTPAADGQPSTVLAERLAKVDAGRLADEMGVGMLLLNDILSSLARPGRDPREDLRPPIFRREVLKLEDLKAGMELSGTVLNVVDFGAFVDIGLSDSGLIHISRLANRYVSDPHEVVSVGDILNVWVVEVDEKRRRVSLTAIAPGTESHGDPAKSKATGQAPSKRRKPRRDKNAPPPTRRGKGSGRASGTWRPKPKARPKPSRPITEAMADGKEPMRAFSDLQQFFEKKKHKKSDGGKSANESE